MFEMLCKKAKGERTQRTHWAKFVTIKFMVTIVD